MKGVISYFNQVRKFGFIESKDQNGWISKFFFLQRGIIRCEVDQPAVGLRVQFNVSTTQQADGKFPLAIDIEVFAPVNATAVAALSCGGNDNGPQL